MPQGIGLLRNVIPPVYFRSSGLTLSKHAFGFARPNALNGRLRAFLWVEVFLRAEVIKRWD